MRLIDKDALIKLGKKKYLGEDRECFVVKLDVFNNAPTVEAIPIEWLKEQAEGTTYQHRVEGLIERWRREHETD